MRKKKEPKIFYLSSEKEVREFLKEHPDKVYSNLLGPYELSFGASYSSANDTFCFVSYSIRAGLRAYGRTGKWTFNKRLTKKWQDG